MSGLQSLHSHTTNSDGKLGYIELLESASKYGISTIALTDHDMVMDPAIIPNLNSTQVNWISGIEISSGLPKEMGINSNGPHIVGLFVDPTNIALREYCTKAKQARIDVMKKRVVKLSELGFIISENDILTASKGESVGRPHLVQALNSHPENKKVMDDLVIKMSLAAKDDPMLQKKYDEMMTRGPGQYPYVLFLSDDAFLPGINCERDYWADFDQAVEFIRNAGGLAFFAHYSSERNKISLQKLEELLTANRIDGVETVYGLWEHGTPKESETNEDRNQIRAILKRDSKLASGGADIHTLDDIINFTNAKEYASETIGMVEQIIESTNIDTTWSSFK